MMFRVLTEKKMQRNMTALGAVVALSATLLVISAAYILSSLKIVETSSADSATRMQAVAVSQEILRHIDSDFRIMRTLAIFLDTSNVILPQERSDDEFVMTEAVQSMQSLVAAVQSLNVDTSFFSISWYSDSGEGVRIHIENNTVQRTWLSDDSLIAQETIGRAFAGEMITSPFHFDPVAQRRILIHALPVYIEGRIAGVVAAVCGAGRGQQILENAAEAARHYSYFLVDESSNFVASASSDNFTEIIQYTQGAETLMLPVLPPDARNQIQRVRDGFISIWQGGAEYRGYVQPLGSEAANMRVICINTDINTASATNQQISAARVTFFAFCALVALSLILGTALTYTYGSRLVRFLFFDELTGADNINRFRRKLSSRLEKPQGGDDYYICLASINVRHFRSIAEIFGTESANQLLLIIKETLEENTSGDEFFCRESYDVFYACLHEREEDAVRARIGGIEAEIAKKYLEVRDYHVKFYAGAVILEGDALDKINSAGIFSALALAREKARASLAEAVCFYDEKLHAGGETASYIETHMEQALADKSFKLYLQPKIDLASGTLGGAEALVRWNPNGGRMIFPDQFIPLFNKNGFCVKLDMYMLEQACALISSWIERGIEPIQVSVNQSRLLFFEASYVDNVSAIASKYRIPPGLVTLEILEEVYLENTDEVNAKIAELRKRGFLISMDDFGSGYSSFSTIGELRLDELKLDRKFLMAASGNEGWRMKIVIDQVVRMARRLHLTVVAEGIENKEDEQLVKLLGCDYGQGYYYCKPIPADEFNERYMHSILSSEDDWDDEPFPPEF